jgi:hypothetical protein
VNNSVYVLTVHDDGGGPALYAGGLLTSAGGTAARSIAKWDGASWTTLGSGIDADVYALTVYDDGRGPALCAGGLFTSAGGTAANSIAKWNGASWTALGSGVSGVSASVFNALTVYDDGGGPALYAGGTFTSAGGVPATYIAKWDGSSWTPSWKRDDQLRQGPDGVRRRRRTGALRRRSFHGRGRQSGEPYREVGRLELDRSWKRDE